MSNINLTIGGRTFAVACAPGEEAHIEALGRTIDAKLAGMPGIASQGEARMLLFAALLLADELHEARGGLVARPAETGSNTAEALEALADRLDSLAARLEG